MGLDKIIGPDDLHIRVVNILAKQDIMYVVEAMNQSTTTRNPRNMEEDHDGADIRRTMRYTRGQ